MFLTYPLIGNGATALSTLGLRPLGLRHLVVSRKTFTNIEYVCGVPHIRGDKAYGIRNRVAGMKILGPNH